jgi:hypothetical protein
MVASDKLFAGSIPEIYDRFLVPLIFEPYARDLAGRLAQTAPRNVLETAAGTGVLTRAMASILPAEARIAARSGSGAIVRGWTDRMAASRRAGPAICGSKL